MAELSGWNRALFRFRPQLEDRLKIEHHISSLHEAVPGGFLTSREEKDIMSQTTDYSKVRKFVDILATKDEKAFDAVVAFLKTTGQAELAEELESAAKEDERQDMSSNTGEAPMGPTTVVSTTNQDMTTTEATQQTVPAQQDLSKETTCKPATDVQKDALTRLKQRYLLDDKLLRILVVGEPGSGKSTLIQNLFGVKARGRQGELCEHSVAPEGCRLVLYISYGAQEDTEKHLRTITQMVLDESLSLVIYCFPMNDTRLRDGFFGTFKKHNEIGIKWGRSLLALTFADELPVPRQERKLPDFDSGTFFLKKKEDWVREMKQHVLDNAVLPASAFSALHIHSTTEHSTVSLPDGRDWYAPLWDDILDILLPTTTSM